MFYERPPKKQYDSSLQTFVHILESFQLEETVTVNMTFFTPKLISAF